MEPVLTPAQMRAADLAAIEAGTPEPVLMDRAAFACAMTVLRMLGSSYGKRVVVVCGKGNNGGDGHICAAHLRSRGVHVTVCSTTSWDRAAFERAASRAHLVIDAILGTGSSGAPRGDVADAIDAVASCSRRLFAIDMPSGVDGTDGSVAGVAVTADVTLAIQSLKIGHVSMPGALHCGRIDVADIGIPVRDVHTFVPSPRDVRAVLPEHTGETHKYAVGALGLLAGSAGMTGAAILAARGAIRAGAGLVIMGVAASSLEVVESAVIEAIKVPLPDSEGQLEGKSVDAFADKLERCEALAVGPGLGRGPRAVEVVRACLRVALPMVIDGDGLWALAEILRDEPDAVSSRPAPTVLTPHTGEFALLAGRPVGADRVSDVRDHAHRWGAVVHLKGRRQVTASPDGSVWINTSGNPGAATGGTGDVLTGVIGALLAQGVMPQPATWAGAYLHGWAADIAAARRGEASLQASDLPDALPDALVRASRAKPFTGRLRTVLA